jgi:hypothetical protein
MNNLGESSEELITKHIEKYIGKIDGVFHEIVSDIVHIDIIIVAPTKESPNYKLFTSGMSDKPMNFPEGVNSDTQQYLELMITLPGDWKIKEFKNDDYYWPIRLLKKLARFPHEYDTNLGSFHTMANTPDYLPYASNTGLCASMLSPPFREQKEFSSLKINNEKTIYFYSVNPMYKEEVEFKLNNDFDIFWNLLMENKFSFDVRINRRNMLKKQSFLKELLNKFFD